MFTEPLAFCSFFWEVQVNSQLFTQVNLTVKSVPSFFCNEIFSLSTIPQHFGQYLNKVFRLSKWTIMWISCSKGLCLMTSWASFQPFLFPCNVSWNSGMLTLFVILTASPSVLIYNVMNYGGKSFNQGYFISITGIYFPPKVVCNRLSQF